MNVDMFIIILFILFILEYKYSNYIKVIIKRGFYYDDFLFFRIYLVLFIVLDIFFFKFLVFKFI